MAKGNYTTERWTAKERKANREWLESAFMSGRQAVDIAKEAIDKGISRDTVYRVGREIKGKIENRQKQVSDIVSVIPEVAERVDVETLPHTKEEFKAKADKEYNSWEARWLKLKEWDRTIAESVGVAKIMAMTKQEEYLDKYCPPGEGESEEIRFRIYPDCSE